MVRPGVVDEQHVESVPLAQLVGQVHEGGGGRLGDAIVDEDLVGVVGDQGVAGVTQVVLIVLHIAWKREVQQHSIILTS